MKIDKPSKPLPSPSLGEGAHAATRGKSSPRSTAQPSGGTSVSLGSAAAGLRTMENSMANTSVVDAAKVAEIKQAIAEGRFKVNSEAVAGRLIETVRDLISNRA